MRGDNHRMDTGNSNLPATAGYRLAAVVFGALLAAVGVELFLAPSGLIVAGMTGVSMLAAPHAGTGIGLLLFAFNLPFLLRQGRLLPSEQRMLAAQGLVAFGVFASLLHAVQGLTDELLPAAIVGGAVLGLGFRVALRYGGFLDVGASAVPRTSRGMAGYAGRMLLSVTVMATGALLLEWHLWLHSVIAVIVAFLAAARWNRATSLSLVLTITTIQADTVVTAVKQAAGSHGELQGLSTDAERQTFTIEVRVARLAAYALREAVLRADPEAIIRVTRDEHPKN
ncbi:uncharacterized membrane-anchored protein YitT (DUF2179 family) [Paenibacillus phyllosphaerae]|uniref:Uncharacterized membrane-anchored protein YitT (DUF2179 family) n=1 Tax=Paenibacillus phyllosphaerae TaxID=274593 RepID=A0A7W5B1E5_9BACL|nr:YitT family protein [Paenibacillus phyllosphaerae]MBB3111921.1 uncharacterized membrane-anchored protein YitT (DUF2179 family) [Paenibacillus phyllosphaerae]